MLESCNVAFPSPIGFITCAPSEEPLEITAGTAIKQRPIARDKA